MDDTQPQFLDVGSGPDRRRIAYLRQPARHPEKPSLMFLSGFKSEMRAIKAGAVAQWAGERGIGCLRFDYSGHGQSEGRLRGRHGQPLARGDAGRLRSADRGPAGADRLQHGAATSPCCCCATLLAEAPSEAGASRRWR
jgi:pimeloyl-ACP methyl ester carboxylesterase